jgi:hypothetical protein
MFGWGGLGARNRRPGNCRDEAGRARYDGFSSVHRYSNGFAIEYLRKREA